MQDSINFWEEFEASKIIFPDIASRNQFTIDENGLYLDMTAFFIPGNDKYLLGVLNSKAVLYFFDTISSSIRGGFLRWKKQYVELIPIPAATPAEQAAVAALVTGILAAKAADPAADTREAEAAVDAAVAALYGVALPAAT